MNNVYTTFSSGGSKWTVHNEDMTWALSKVSVEECDTKPNETLVKLVGLLFHFGRRISPAIG